jgi:hypothetical protein
LSRQGQFDFVFHKGGPCLFLGHPPSSSAWIEVGLDRVAPGELDVNGFDLPEKKLLPGCETSFWRNISFAGRNMIDSGKGIVATLRVPCFLYLQRSAKNEQCGSSSSAEIVELSPVTAVGAQKKKC